MAPHPRPTTDVGAILLDSIDGMYAQLIARLEGLSDEEYRWEPVADMWAVRPDEEGSFGVDGAGVRSIDPAPVTTIAWRLWHLALDCFDDYTRRLVHADGADAIAEWTPSASTAIATLDDRWQAFRTALEQRDWWEELGDLWGPFARHNTADIALHASNELVHHGAEIALLRDLYRATGEGGTVLSR
ncbi:MAG: DinB family protein [Actinomycetota bacterium]